jgi:hypothetical protein
MRAIEDSLVVMISPVSVVLRPPAFPIGALSRHPRRVMYGRDSGVTISHERRSGVAPIGRTRLSTDQQHGSELDRLRSQVNELRSQLATAQERAATAEVQARAAKEGAPAPRARRRIGWRGPVATVLIVLGCVLAPVSVLAVWSANQVSNTSRYVENVAPLISDPAVRGAITDKVSTQITDKLNVQGVAKTAAAQLSQRGLTRLGALLSTFSGSIASGVGGLIHSAVAKIVASPVVKNIWIQGNRIGHTQLVRALSGQSSSLTTSNGKVVLGLGPFIDQVKHRLAARGLTLVDKLPYINPTIPLFDAKYLVRARSLYNALTTLKWALPLITLVLLAAGVYVARRHRRALIGAGLGVAGSMLVLGIGIAVVRTIYLNKVPSSVLPADAAAVVFDTIVRFIRQGLRVVLVLGLVVALAGFFTGPSVTAVRTRRALTSTLAWVRGAGESAGVRTGPVGSWVYKYRRPLRIAAVIVAVAVFIFWGNPTAPVVVLIALVLIGVLGLIELVGRPPARAASTPGGGQS